MGDGRAKAGGAPPRTEVRAWTEERKGKRYAFVRLADPPVPRRQFDAYRHALMAKGFGFDPDTKAYVQRLDNYVIPTIRDFLQDGPFDVVNLDEALEALEAASDALPAIPRCFECGDAIEEAHVARYLETFRCPACGDDEGAGEGAA